MSEFATQQYWALIVGGSSGIGLATAKKLARHGMHLMIVHKDRRNTLARVEKIFDEIRAEGVELISFNQDGVNPESIERLAIAISDKLESKAGKLKVFLHAVAQGNLKALLPSTTEVKKKNTTVSESLFFELSEGIGGRELEQLKKQDIDLTINAMGSSFAIWVQQLVEKNVFAQHARVLGLTSEGTQKVWGGYAAVAMAKSVLETLVKYLAVELASRKITANLIQAGTTDTPSLRQIPGSDLLLKYTASRNPNKRITHPSDVADVIYLLCKEEANWINGTTIVVDGGEHLV